MSAKFLLKLFDSVRAEEAAKRVDARRKIEEQGLEQVEIADVPPDEPEPETPPPPPAAPLVTEDALVAIDERLRSIEAADEQARQEARRAYLALLATFAPPRAGPAPAVGAHALVAAPEASPPSSTDAVSILRAAGKTRDDLRRDVAAWTQLRDQADVAATLPSLVAALRAADAELAAMRDAYEEAKVKWETRIDAKRSRVFEASSRRAAADKAVDALACSQGLDREQAARLDGLERVFFPPPPPPPPPERDPNVTTYEGYTYEYHPRSEP